MTKDEAITNLKHAAEGFKLDAQVKDSWLKKLRSGTFARGRGYLCRNHEYCCLGVLAHESLVYVRLGCYGIEHNVAYLPTDYLPKDVQDQLAMINDHVDIYANEAIVFTFEDIADIIETVL